MNHNGYNPTMTLHNVVLTGETKADNITVSGDTTVINTSEILISDPLIKGGDNNINNDTLGIYFQYKEGAQTRYIGLLKNNTESKKMYLYDSTIEPTGALDISNELATLEVFGMVIKETLSTLYVNLRYAGGGGILDNLLYNDTGGSFVLSCENVNAPFYFIGKNGAFQFMDDVNDLTNPIFQIDFSNLTYKTIPVNITQWTYLSQLNQSLTTTSNPTFNSINGLTSTEINQLKNIDTSVISTAQWGYLAGLNQALTTTSDPTFNSINGLTTAEINQLKNIDTNVISTAQWTYLAGLNVGTLTDLTAGEINQLKNIDTSVISTTQWGYLAGLNQALSTTSSPSFTGITSSNLYMPDTNTRIYKSGTELRIQQSNGADDINIMCNGNTLFKYNWIEKMRVNNTLTSTSNLLEVSNITDSTSSTSNSSIKTAGGLSVAKSVYIGDILNIDYNAGGAQLRLGCADGSNHNYIGMSAGDQMIFNANVSGYRFNMAQDQAFTIYNNNNLQSDYYFYTANGATLGEFFSRGNIRVGATTLSTGPTTTASIQTAGGVSIAGNLAVGTDLSLGTGVSLSPGCTNLNYYKSGTWTPLLKESINGSAFTDQESSGSYAIIGNMCTIYFYIRWNSHAGVNTSYTFTLTGLPTECYRTAGSFYHRVQYSNVNNSNTRITNITHVSVASSPNGHIGFHGEDATFTFTPTTSQVTPTGHVYCTCTYFVG